MLEVVKGLAIFSQRIHHLGQAVGPQPGRIERFKLLPASRAVSPDLEASRIPIVSKQVGGAFGAIELESRTPVALNAMTGNQRLQRTILML